MGEPVFTPWGGERGKSNALVKAGFLGFSLDLLPVDLLAPGTAAASFCSVPSPREGFRFSPVCPQGPPPRRPPKGSHCARARPASSCPTRTAPAIRRGRMAPEVDLTIYVRQRVSSPSTAA